jgi:ADP-sugar diphosphatase
METAMNSNNTLPFKIRLWHEHVTRTGCRINTITSLADVNKSNGDHLFSLMETDVISPEGTRLPHIVFIRGNATVIVPLLINADTGDERFLMVLQRRIGNGELNLEFPAGMLDHEDDDPAEIAVKELYEETGFQIEKNILQPLSPKPLYSSSGGSDEAIFYFGCTATVSNDEFETFKNRICGNTDENEHIAVSLIEKDIILNETISLQAQLGYFLFKEQFCVK